MSEENPNCKRDAGEFEASSTSVSPLKKKKLDDSSPDSHGVVLAAPSPTLDTSADSAPGGCSVTSAGEDDDKSSIICSGCFSSESNEISKNNHTFVADLEAHQISESETSTLITSNFRKEGNLVSEALGEITETESSSATERDNRRKPRGESKRPTPAEIEEFFSKLGGDDEQKRFIEKYNFDIVNDKPLEGRYKWDRLKP